MQNIYDDDRFFAGYQQLRESKLGLNEAIEQPAFRALLPPFDGLRVLDLGCGDGELARWCRARGAVAVVGVDISERMLGLARERTADDGITYVRSGLEVVQFEPASFDLVTSSFALHYVRDYPAVMGSIAEWLRPGGTLVYSVEHPVCTAQVARQGWASDHVGRRLFWALDDYGYEGQRQQTWFVSGVVKFHRTVASLVNGAVAAGFTVERLEEPGPTPEAVRDRPDLIDERRRPAVLVLKARKPA
ncbi:MAG: class I SAM-dependent methyltransferase [Chloroflexi bacterium]|nr:class I SAM-dependent methyltransferase [Chloroflexota bacterium]